MYGHCHYPGSFYEPGQSLVFTRSAESLVALVIPTATVGHAHPQTGCPVVLGPAGPSPLLWQLQISPGKRKQRAAMELSQMAQEVLCHIDTASVHTSQRNTRRNEGACHAVTQGQKQMGHFGDKHLLSSDFFS